MDQTILIGISALVILVNIITEVCKNVFPNLNSSKTINVFVLCLSVVSTLVAYFFYVHYKSLVFDVYGVVTAIIVGFMVAYSAMFGFDKLLVYIEPLFKGGNK